MAIYTDYTDYIMNISDVKTGMLCVIQCYSARERKKIHQYIDDVYPKVRKTSLYIDRFHAEQRVLFGTCWECGYKSVPMSYKYGMMDNNKDEYYSGSCPKCDEYASYEPNYDDNEGIRRVWHNNVVVIGDYLQFNKPSHATDAKISKEEFDEIVNRDFYLIDAPRLLNGPNKRYLNKRKLQKYIDKKIGNLGIEECIVDVMTRPLYDKNIVEIILDY